MDFTIDKYIELLISLKNKDYQFQTFSDFLKSPKSHVVVLRHDVDLLPNNSLRFAKIQHDLGIQGTYYFRAVPESWDERVIAEIAGLGHEIGYHYENLTTCNGDVEKAMEDFSKNLEALRIFASVKSICMHGSPASKYDSKDLWRKFNYKDFGILGEPYFDVDFNRVFYLTDTGRRWDGHKVSVRDKVKTNYTETFHSTSEIIEALQQNLLPDQIMFTFHPQRWHDNYILWTRELLLQNTKNIIKRYFFVARTKA